MVVFDFNLLLPFFFMLAIVYGALEISKVFENKGVKAIIAVVIAFFSISSPAIIELVIFFLPYAALFFIAFFFLGFVMSFFKDGKGGKKDYVLIIIVLGLLLLFISSEEYQDIINIQDQNFIGMVVLLVVVLILYAAYRIEGKET